MKVSSRDEFIENTEWYAAEAGEGALFFYPTDTIYGLWWVVSKELIERIDAVKDRPSWKFYSVIVPWVWWIQQECVVWEFSQSDWDELVAWVEWWITVLFPLKEKSEYNEIYTSGSIAVRMIDHPFQAFVEKLEQPFITTSANYSGQPQVSHFSQLDERQQWLVDFVIDCWVLEWKWSTIIDWKTWEKIR